MPFQLQFYTLTGQVVIGLCPTIFTLGMISKFILHSLNQMVKVPNTVTEASS
jgi:hypothetical protein